MSTAGEWLATAWEYATDPKVVAGALFVVAAGLLTHFWGRYRNRIVRVKWWVTGHNRVAISADTPRQGRIAVTYNNEPVEELYLSNVRALNDSERDLENIPLKITMGATGGVIGVLRAEAYVEGVLEPLEYSERYRQAVARLAGMDDDALAADPDRLHIASSVEFIVPVLNRGRAVNATILSRCPRNQKVYAVVGVARAGVEAVEDKTAYQPQLYGVPTPHAVRIGLSAALLVSALAVVLLPSRWGAAGVALATGLTAQLIGVGLIKSWRFATRLAR